MFRILISNSLVLFLSLCKLSFIKFKLFLIKPLSDQTNVISFKGIDDFQNDSIFYMIQKENSHGKNAVNVMYRIVDTKILLNYFHLCQRPKKV